MVQFVVTGSAIASNNIWTSPTGLAGSWTARTCPSGRKYAVAYNSSFYVCPIANTTTCLTSVDGVVWTSRTLPAANDWRGIACNSDIWVIVSGSGFATSTDGITWAPRVVEALPWTSIAWDGRLFIAVQASGSNLCTTSPDGIVWSTVSMGSAIWQGIATNGSIWVAVGAGCSTSEDGVTWTSRTIPGSYWQGVAWNGSVFCAVRDGANAISSDGINWIAGTTVPWGYRIAWNGALFLVIDPDSASPQYKTSPNGVDWTQGSPLGTWSYGVCGVDLTTWQILPPTSFWQNFQGQREVIA